MNRLRAVALGAVIAGSLAACSGPRTPSADAIRARIDRGDLQTAVVQLKAAVQKDPQAPALRLLLGRVLLLQEQPVLAEVELRKALADPALRTQAVPLLAQALLEARQYDKLIAEFADVRLDDRPASLLLRTVLADAAARAGKADQARAWLDEVLQQQSDFSPAVLLDVRRRAGEGDLPGATERLKAMLAREPGNVDALLLWADLQSAAATGDDAALAAYRQVLTVKDSSVPAHAAVVGILLRKKDLAAAGEALAAMQKTNPLHLQTLFMEAQLALARHEFKRAAEITQTILGAAPDSVSALQLAALIDLRANNLQRAESHLVKALQARTGQASTRKLLAETYNRTGQSDKALAVLKPLLQAGAGERDAAVLRLAGDAAMVAGDIAQAANLYAAAARIEPDNVQLRTSLAVADIARGQVDQGLRSLRAIAESQTADASADMVLVTTLLQSNDPAGALKVLDGLAARKPDTPGVDLMRGRVQLLLGDRSAARQTFEAAVKKHPSNYPSVVALAMLDVAEQRFSSAADRLNSLLKGELSASTRSAALRSLAGIRYSAKAPQDEVVRLLREAVAADPSNEPSAVMLVDGLLRARQVESALSAAQGALTKLPESPSVLDALGRAQMAAGDMGQAGSTFGKVLRLQPRSAVAHLRLAQTRVLSGDPKGALPGYIRALSLDPELAEAQSDLAKLSARPGLLPPVLAAVRGVQKEHPDQAFAYQIEGDLHLARRAFDEAIAAYRKGLTRQQPGRLPVRLHRAYVSAGKTGEAQQFAASWTRSQPRDLGFLQHVADLAMSTRDHATAQAYYRKLIALAPNNHTALNNLAWLLTQARQAGAVELAQRAVQAAPGQTAVMDTLAHALAAERQNDKAVELADRILALEPGNPVFQLSMAKVFAEAGQPKRALDTLALLEKSSPAAATRDEAAALRQKLGAAK